MNVHRHVARSADGVPIHYDVQGSGATALVFVHGWCCNRHHWGRQVDHFAPDYTVVSLDLAGHGASGVTRKHWTIPAFGEDVAAVVQQLELKQVVLIGHSMSGPVIVEAARRLPGAVIGLVGADTWQNVQQTRTPVQIADSIAGYRSNFAETARVNIRNMFGPKCDPVLVETIAAEMSARPPHIGIGMVEELGRHDRTLQIGLQEIKVPKITINSAWRTTNVEAARHYGIEVLLMPDVGHFVMMEDPGTFNRLLGEVVNRIIATKTSQSNRSNGK